MNENVKAGIGINVGSRFFIIVFGIFLAIFGGCKKEQQALSTELLWKTQDGFTQQGTLYLPLQENPPGLILVHANGGGRSDWSSFAVRAKERGYMVLAYDIRGHGDSSEQNGILQGYAGFEKEDWELAIADIGLVKAQLLAQGVSSENLFIVGASVGANMAVKYGDGDGDIQGAVLLSPGIEYKDIKIENIVKGNRRLPMLLMASEGDRYSADSIEKMKVWSPSYTEMRTYSGTSHGTDLLFRSEQILEDIFGWLEPIVK